MVNAGARGEEGVNKRRGSYLGSIYSTPAGEQQ